MNIFNRNIILNSRSPRRKQILSDMGLSVTAVSTDADENCPQDIPVEKKAEYIAMLKDQAYTLPLADKDVLISADTVVVCNSMVMGKPKDETDARRMLKTLSSNRHSVITGCVVRTPCCRKVFSDITQVYFRELTDEDIEYYIRTKRPFDKAGSYGIQEWIGMAGIYKIEGDYYNVMGLPACKVWQTINSI